MGSDRKRARGKLWRVYSAIALAVRDARTNAAFVLGTLALLFVWLLRPNPWAFSVPAILLLLSLPKFLNSFRIRRAIRHGQKAARSIEPALVDHRPGRRVANHILEMLCSSQERDPVLAAYDNASILFVNADYEGAIKVINQALNHGLISASLYCVRALCNRCLDDFEGALQDFNTAITMDPYNAEAYNQRGMVKQYAFRDREGALRDYSRAIELNSFNVDAYLNRALLKEGKAAIKDLTKAISLTPCDAQLYLVRGLRYCEVKDYRRSIQDLTVFIELEPDQADMTIPEAYSFRGMARYFAHDYRGAIEDNNKAIDMDPLNGAAHQFRGLAKLALGLDDEGREDLSRAKALGHPAGE